MRERNTRSTKRKEHIVDCSIRHFCISDLKCRNVGCCNLQCVPSFLCFLCSFPALVYGCRAEEPMHRMKLFVLAAFVATSVAMLAQTPTVTVFEGARVIIG